MIKMTIELLMRPALRFSANNSSILNLLKKDKVNTGDILIKNFSLEVEANTILSIMGESGIGKTTLLRVIAGLESNYRGTTMLNGLPVTRPSRAIFLMSQDHGLLPWMTLIENIRFCRNPESSVFREMDLLRSLGLSHIQDQFPKTLSSGERARGALACAIAANPEILLLDEPFKSLDSEWRRRVEDILLSWTEQSKTPTAIILVTHLAEEAIYIGDKVLLLSGSPLAISSVEDTAEFRDRNSFNLKDLASKINARFGEIIAPLHDYRI